MPMKKAKEPIYLTPFAEAVEIGEVKLYHASMQINMNCARAIDKAINDCYKGEHIYDLKSAVKSVISEYGAERTKFVTAVHLKKSSYDGRFSHTNKTWAATISIAHFEEFKFIYVSTHSSILDGFCDYLREIAESQTKLKIGGYSVKKSTLFSDNQGVAYGESKSFVAPFVTWQFSFDPDNGERNYFSSKYYAYKDSAIAEYKRRIVDYKADNRVSEVKEIRTKKEITP